MRKLKETESFDNSAIVHTFSMNDDNITLRYYDRYSSRTEYVTITKECYTKRFLMNSVDAFAIGCDAQHILKNVNRYLTETRF
jgi:hypothetical protein